MFLEPSHPSPHAHTNDAGGTVGQVVETALGVSASGFRPYGYPSIHTTDRAYPGIHRLPSAATLWNGPPHRPRAQGI